MTTKYIISPKELLSDECISKLIPFDDNLYSLFNAQVAYIVGLSDNNIKIPQDIIDQWYIIYAAISPLIINWRNWSNRRLISYSYFIHHICKLLGHNEYIKYFPTFNNYSQLYDYDHIWSKICNHFKWQNFTI